MTTNAPSSAVKPTGRRRELLEALLRQQGIAAADPDGIPRLRHEGPAPLSFAQQRLWFLHQIDPDLRAYNVAAAIVLEGAVEAGALDLALRDLILRHEALRTTFPYAGGTPVQSVAPPPQSPLGTVDLQGVAGGETEAWRIAQAEAERPFDLTAGPLLRAVLLRAGDRSILVLVLHHIVCDGWSRGILLGELAELYTERAGGPPAGLRELPVQYRDFAVWQRGLDFAEQLAYWRQRLGGAPVLPLPLDRPRPHARSYRGALLPLRLPAAVAAPLRDLGRDTGTTLFMALMAAFQIVLSRWSGETDLVVGSPAAGRDRAEIAPLIGFFVNLVGLRSDLAGDPAFPELLQQVRRHTLEAYAHQDLPFERLVEELQPERDLGRHPLFQTMLAFQGEPGPELRLPGVRAEVRELHTRTSKYDLLLTLADRQGALEGYLEYDADVFDAATVARLGGHYLNVLRGVAEGAGR
ncbi:MAG TPA: condensation domain-containing protein, partial [Thermoanaerobaculia bacterium]|nr:condensation domain-containing protein [Thermoanaerobaculia bacterium]